MTWEEKKELERKRLDFPSITDVIFLMYRKAAQKAIDRERKEKHRLMEEEREKVRQQLREKYNLENTTNDQQIVIKLLQIFGLTQEKVHLFPTYLKLLIMFVPPVGIVTFTIVMLYVGG